MNSEEFWGLQVQTFSPHPLPSSQPTWKWPPTGEPEPFDDSPIHSHSHTSVSQSPPAADGLSAQQHDSLDDRERFRRKFALAAFKAGIPVPGHLSPEGSGPPGRYYEDVMMMPSDTGCHFEDGSGAVGGACRGGGRGGGGGGYFGGSYLGVLEGPLTPTPPQPVLMGVRKRWRCEVEGCTKRFKSKQALKYHNETGHGKNDRECSGCGKVCKGDKNHRKHVAKCLPRD